MAKEIIGLDISDYSIEAVLMQKKGNFYRVSSYSRFRLSPDIVEDGNILNKNKLKEAIHQTLFHAQPKQIESKKVFLSIPESRSFTKVMSLPDDLSEKDVREAAKNKASEIIPEDRENLVPAIKVLPANNGFRDVFYSAAQLGAIKDLVEVFDGLNMEVVGITTEAVSSYTGLDDRLKDSVSLMMDIGNRTTIASIFDENGIRDTINVNIAGSNIIKSLVAKTGVSYNVAEQKMRDVGMVYSVEHGEIMMIVQGQLQPLLDEMKVFIEYFENSTNKKIEQLILIGGLSHMKGIDKYFGENLSLNTSRGVSFLGDKILPSQASSTKYINALGLARLGFEEVDVNFYNEEFRQKATEKPEPDTEKIDEEYKDKKADKNIDSDDGVKILEEEEVDFEDDLPKPFYKNKVVATILVAIVFVSAFVIIKGFLPQDSEMKDYEGSALREEDDQLTRDPDLGEETLLSRDIVVAPSNNDSSDILFVEAEEYKIDDTQFIKSEDFSFEQFNLLWELGPGALVGIENPNVLPAAEGSSVKVYFTDKEDRLVSSLIDDVKKKSAEDILVLLGQGPVKNSYFVIPSIINTEIKNISEARAENGERFNSRFDISHLLYSIPEKEVEQVLLSDLNKEQQSKFINSDIINRNYTIIKREGNNFYLRADYLYQEKVVNN